MLWKSNISIRYYLNSSILITVSKIWAWKECVCFFHKNLFPVLCRFLLSFLIHTNFSFPKSGNILCGLEVSGTWWIAFVTYEYGSDIAFGSGHPLLQLSAFFFTSPSSPLFHRPVCVFFTSTYESRISCTWQPRQSSRKRFLSLDLPTVWQLSRVLIVVEQGMILTETHLDRHVFCWKTRF